jgi:hypothetical protein
MAREKQNRKPPFATFTKSNIPGNDQLGFWNASCSHGSISIRSERDYATPLNAADYFQD